MEYLTKQKLIAECVAKAEEKYGKKSKMYALWGCAQVFLTEEQLKIILSVVGSK